jgi:hypothetical protein
MAPSGIRIEIDAYLRFVLPSWWRPVMFDFFAQFGHIGLEVDCWGIAI